MSAAWREGRRSHVEPRRTLCALLACAFASFAFADEVVTFGPFAGGAARPVTTTTDLIAQGLAYEHGEGVPKDQRKAAMLYCEAARDGDPEAQFSLGWMFANARGVTRDDTVAASLFALAAAAGHEQARRSLAFVGDDRGPLPECMRPIEAASDLPPGAPFEITLDDPDPFLGLPPWKRKIADVVVQLAPRYAVDPRLALAVIAVESNFEVKARSEKDARGLMQLIPETAARFNVRDAYDIKDNVRGGLAYLRWLLAYYRGQVQLAAAAYNAGEKAVDRYRGVPPYLETREYVKRIQRLFRNDVHPYDARIVDPSPIVAEGPKS
ncbi:MAG: transglycosylase SLT domain-containing protein [Burkholderiales bacterium]|nr:transglycosylase SLT domain-containing protein [Burkholderiales bacterium]